MKRLTMMLTGLLVAFCASAAVTSRSYVQQGLVAQYDGINNVGHDAAHSDSAATWADLTGHGNDATKDANVTWATNGWVNGADCYPMSVTSRGISAVTATKVFTMEFATKPSRHTVRQCFFGQYDARGFSIEHNSSASALTKNGFFRLYYYFDGSSVLDSNYVYVKQTSDEWASMSVASDTSRQTIRKNGTFAMTIDKPATGKLTSDCNSVIGGDISRTSMAFRGTYNAFRLYDRVLTDRESKINAAVDAVRYNNADWNDYPELACYSFDASGNLQKSLLAVALENGSVKIGDGAAAASAATEPAAYGSGAQTATFTAVPASGYVFYRWEGDTDAIASGTVVTPTVTVTAEKGARLVATFRALLNPAARTVTSRSYVQNGLIAQYDGINNVGHDESHSTSTTTWVDLTGNGADGACVTAVSAGFSWSGNGWSITNSCKPVTVSSYRLSQTIATGTFTIQFACVPSIVNERMCYFGQYNGKEGDVNVEQTTAKKLRLYRNNMTGVTSGKSYDWASTGADYMAVGGFSSVSYAVNSTSASLYVGGECKETKIADFITAHTNVTSVIGGEHSRPAFAFKGTYNAFRLYSRALTDRENKLNAAIDDIRFNNGANLQAGYSLDGDGALKVLVSATATVGGKVSIRGGAAASFVSDNVYSFDSDYMCLEAFPEEGYVFDRWTGDTDAITDGHVVAMKIAVDTLAPVTLKAVFRKPGNALDGMIFDLDIRDVEDDHIMSGTSSEYHVGDALKAGSSSSNRYYTALYTPAEACRPIYRFMDIPMPSTPFTTNAAQPCIYVPQAKGDGNNYYVGRWELPNNYVDGPVATFYVRFLWEGPLVPGIANDSCIICNGYNTWADVGRGFVLRLRTPSGGGANDNKGFVNVFVPNHVPDPVDYSTDLYVTSNSWVDCFVSVYPSPTDVERSNADVWFCQTPALGSNGIFGRPVLKHKHLGDECELPRFRDVTSGHAIRFGAESSGTTDNDEYIRKAFRGYYADIKAWNRVLTENEMWSVMAGRYGGTFNVGVENDSADEFGGPWYGRRADPFDVATNKWQEMKKSLTAEDRTLTLVVPIPAESDGMSRVLEIVPLFDGVGASCPVTVAVNGVTVDTVDLMDEGKRAIPIRGNLVKRDENGKITIAITRPEGCAGTLSFDALSMGGSWQVATENGTSTGMTSLGQGVGPVFVAGDPVTKHAPSCMSNGSKDLTIPFNVPKSSAGQFAYRYDTAITLVETSTPPRIWLELNGNTIWSSASAAKGKIRVDIPAESILPGLNELKWRYDTTKSANIFFDYHKMKMFVPTGMMLIIR